MQSRKPGVAFSSLFSRHKLKDLFLRAFCNEARSNVKGVAPRLFLFGIFFNEAEFFEREATQGSPLEAERAAEFGEAESFRSLSELE
jgi:hypothetical protein